MTGLVRTENWRPLLIETFTVDGKKKATISYRNNEVTFDIPARKLRKTVKLRGDYYDFNTLSCLFRAYPFGAKEKIGFNLW